MKKEKELIGNESSAFEKLKHKEERRAKIRRFWLAFFVTASLAGMAFMILWSNIKFNAGIKCPFYFITKMHCPGCGITRMCRALLNGNMYQAFRYNAYVFCTGPILAIAYIWQVIVFIKSGKMLKHIDIFLVTYAIAMIIFGILRNIPTFSYLAPTIIK